MEQLTAGLGAGSSPGLREILHVLGKWKAVIVLVVVAAVGTSGVFSFFLLPKVYKASATIDVAQLVAPASAGSAGNQASNLQGVVNAVTSQPVATMPTLLWEITSPAILTVASTDLATQGIPISVGALAGMVSATQISSTDLLTVSGTNNDPRLAAAIANAVAQAVVSKEGANTTGHMGQALQLLESQATSVKAQLDAASAALAQAEEQPGAAVSTASVLSTDSQQLASLTGEYSQAQVDLQAALGAETQLRSSLAGVQPTISTSSGGSGAASVPQANPEYQSLSQQLSSQQIQLAVDTAKAQALYQQELQYSYAVQATEYLAAKQAYDAAEVTVKGDEAGIQALQTQIAQTPATLPQQQQASSVTTAPNPAYTLLEQQLQSQEVTIAEDQAKVSQLAQEIPPLKQQLTTLNQESTSANATVSSAESKVADLTSTYQTLETNITKTQVEQAVSGGVSPVQLDEPATVPGAPISPKKKLNVALAFLIGLVAGCALAFVLEQFDNTIKTPEDVRRVAGLPTLAVIPFVRP